MSDITAIRVVALRQLMLLAEGTRNLGTAAVQNRLHNEFADGNITADQLRRLQSEWNGVQDHLDLFMSALAAIRMEVIDDAHDDKVSRDMDPDPDGDRDYAGPCPACGNSLPLDAECRCGGCGNG